MKRKVENVQLFLRQQEVKLKIKERKRKRDIPKETKFKKVKIWKYDGTHNNMPSLSAQKNSFEKMILFPKTTIKIIFSKIKKVWQ